MSITTVIRDFLETDATLLATLTGGIYSEDEVGRNGLSEERAPNAFTTGGSMKPNAIVQQRTEFPWGGGNDSQAKWNTQRAVVEIYLRTDGAGTYSALETAANRIARDLHNVFVTGAGALKEIYKTIDRDGSPAMENALLIRLDYQVVYGRQL
jgi:hypothetical protein